MQPERQRSETTEAPPVSQSEIMSNERACELQLDASSIDDVKDVLDSPRAEKANGNGVELQYRDGAGTTWLFFFDVSGLWTGITLQSTGTAVVPTCWAPDGGWFERPAKGWRDAQNEQAAGAGG